MRPPRGVIIVVWPPSFKYGTAPDLGPRSPGDRRGGKALGAAPVSEAIEPAVGRGVGALSGRAQQGG